jgi:UV DNA damage endonuclease
LTEFSTVFAKRVHPHADYIAISDFPECWLNMSFTLDVEAKAKESAIIKLREDLQRKFKIKA